MSYEFQLVRYCIVILQFTENIFLENARTELVKASTNAIVGWVMCMIRTQQVAFLTVVMIASSVYVLHQESVVVSGTIKEKTAFVFLFVLSMTTRCVSNTISKPFVL